MNFNEYQKLAKVTKKPWESKEGDLADCGLGLAGEAGEVADMIKKHLSGAKPLDAERTEMLKYEMGDILWYMASLCDCIGVDIETIAAMNVEKLKKRHGDKYSGYGNRGEE